MHKSPLPSIEVANCYTHAHILTLLPDDGLISIQVLRPTKPLLPVDEGDDPIYELEHAILQAIKAIYPAAYPSIKEIRNNTHLPYTHYAEIPAQDAPNDYSLGCEIALSRTDTNFVITITAQYL